MIALFGGTFDPIHLGHINMAEQCLKELSLSTLSFIPNATPVHKQGPSITTEHRLAMLKLATDTEPKFTIDTREIVRTEPSYTVLTLQELRNEHPNTPIAFLMGMDSFNSLHTWYQWQAITQLCHIVVYARPGDTYAPCEQLASYLAKAQVSAPASLHQATAGKCYFLTGQTFSAASSEIRLAIKSGKSIEPWLSPKVITYINKNGLYAH
ncbi:nicotinate-nucleotide adenylyltransferase [Pseudoalteromonas luteoviolacea]|uniref:Probable nicotinate-nucleotide adenylyltransferase n=1 Tax=Pseudoalteromonas luteoviolacea H33 TaxID=1365251 RepID=A0A167EG06_9GAMM|nr:nicotinate-nucleotide adenylyltransferase [Pseudoalteromonas luteoviolacea]KZN50703.1 hypothetical protein N476_15550 [Pseudoalteromonas luteoviolacea H33]KZN77647.1 hypothetical protein N477_11795 [Pseudoalteromonas luteoviolacea H33-S]MBQ4877605.1 nicotinate-nucleotide adenylyltransferase [Pseudoalteromonas luteoviolacea]MBQ4906640.1 nicotinate-nucleotide adenylyltransferase [Pseudoalteromonas luteoviolacea]